MVQRTIRDPWNSNGNDAKDSKPWDIIGTLSQTFAKETGLKPGIPICAGAGDTMQSMIGCGVIKPDQAADVAGTCAMFCIATDGINEELSKPEMN